MIIDIAQKPASHCWVVCMDDFKVSFNSLGEAQAFVGLLKARIAAPHVWPGAVDTGDNGRHGDFLTGIAHGTDKNQMLKTGSDQSVPLLLD
ncbi:hypothetical protein SAMN04490202_0316 [Pseudomonas reinekei]|jgi:hypothetical protein|uniref:Uncharacterized protein n=1 Tax=Pseudomonas reinekei TaxID=395598 RepID=A0A1H0I1T3_PSERE|nr:hypothetical protein [Pseudomonas reinekei]KAB0486932.1 hypothetical protein F7R15_08695 [Pseudomonas reinekei]OLU04075.1 hypothetical protein BVK86_07395 [Pseudomonas reinekei]SDO25051.1 hypothetical protein SAMN04490202_0316 [Pseudomonas reinekei]